MKAVIMAGGKGTRIHSITQNEIPKPMLEIEGKTILEYQIESLKNAGIVDIILVIGYLGEKIQDYFKDGQSWGVTINYFIEEVDNPLGTAGSFYYLKNEIKEDFVVLFGDIFLSVDFNKMIQFHFKKSAAATLLTHPNSHPYDSDLVVVDKDNRITKFDTKDKVRDYDYINLVNSGIYVFSPRVFDYVIEQKKYALEKDVIMKMIDSNEKVYSYHSSEYVKDMGTPERYHSVTQDYINGIPEARNLKNKQKCIFLDRDGTINEYIPFLNQVDDFHLIEGVATAIKMINNSEYLCVIVTNQPIIARGESTTENLDNIHKRMDTLLGSEGAYIDRLFYCPHHPDKGFAGEVVELKIDCDCRKPKVGMLLQAAEELNIDLHNSIIIGDSTLDIELGKNAQMKSFLVNTGLAGKDYKYEVAADYNCENLLDAVKLILVD